MASFSLLPHRPRNCEDTREFLIYDKSKAPLPKMDLFKFITKKRHAAEGSVEESYVQIVMKLLHPESKSRSKALASRNLFSDLLSAYFASVE